MAETIVYDDFSQAGGIPNSRWYRQRMPDYEMWDPAVSVACPGAPENTLTLEARRFTLARRDFHDHVKALIYSTADFAPGAGGRIAIATEMAVTTFGTEGNPFGADPGDVRLGCGSFNLIDSKTAMVFDFFVSNRRIAALYERLPFALSPADPYPLFSEIIPTAIPTAPGQKHRYEITYDATQDRVTWLVDGSVVAERGFVGAPGGERGPVVKLTGLKIGGGLFTLLDDLCNDRKRTGDAPKTPGLDPRYERTLFDQGARVSFGAFTVKRS